MTPKQTPISGDSSLEFRPMSDDIIERTLYPKVLPPYTEPDVPADKAFPLRIAALVSDGLYQKLRHEVTILILTETNWLSVMQYARPDILLVESCIVSCTGHWQHGATLLGESADAFKEMVRLANKGDIPTVFWHTLDTSYHKLFKITMEMFSTVFVADPRELAVLKKEKIEAKPLLPAIQPRWQNPFLRYAQRRAFPRTGVLFDGLADLYRLPDFPWALKSIAEKHSLALLDSRWRIWRNKRSLFDDLRARIIGSVSSRDLSAILRYTSVALTTKDTVLQPMSRLCWEIDAAAHGPVIIHEGEGLMEDVFGEFLIHCPTAQNVIEAVDHCMQEEPYRKKKAVLAIRELFRRHTIANRLDEICQSLGISSGWNAYPLITVIAFASSQDATKDMVALYRRQRYPNTELILIQFNAVERKISEDGSDITCLQVPAGLSPHQAFSAALQLANGRVSIYLPGWVQDPNYLMDIHLLGDASGAQIFGYSTPCYFPSGRDVREAPLLENCLLSQTEMANLEAHIAPQLLSGETTYLSNQSVNTIVAECSLDSGSIAGSAQPPCGCLFYPSNIFQSKSNSVYLNLKNGAGVGRPPVDQRITAAMATIPERKRLLPHVISSIIDQVDRLCVYLNGHEAVPECLNHPKITWAWSKDNGDLGAAGKFFFLEDADKGYYLSLDDDFYYPDDYVYKMVTTMKKYDDRVATCVHGSIFGDPLEWYFDRTAQYRSKIGISCDKFITLAGTGTVAFSSERLPLCFDPFFPQIKCDAIFSLLAYQQGMPIVSVARPHKWLQSLETATAGKPYWERMLLNDGDRTATVKRFDWRFSHIKNIVMSVVDHLYPGISAEELKTHQFDLDFIQCAREDTKLKDWDSNSSLMFHRAKVQFLKKEIAIANNTLDGGEHKALCLSDFYSPDKLADLIELKQQVEDSRRLLAQKEAQLALEKSEAQG